MTERARPRRRLLVAAAVLMPLLVAGLAWQQTRPPAFKDVRLVLVDGRKLQGADLLDGPVLLNFWATTCPICIAEMPDLAHLARDYGPRGLTVLAVAMPYDPPDQVVDFTRRRQLPFPVSLDLAGEISLGFGLGRVTPVNILLDRHGVERWRHVGRLPLADARRRIDHLLGDS